MQLALVSGLTGEDYVRLEAWRVAILAHCPLHGTAECLVRHGSYPRKTLLGVRVARWLCERSGVTFSLLPSFLAARLPDTLVGVEAVVAAAEPDARGNPAPTQEALAGTLRPDITLPSALRWLRRRLLPIRAALAAIRGLEPQLFVGCAPSLRDFRSALGTEGVLARLRGIAATHLSALPAPLGFRHRVARRGRRRKGRPHDMGTDPPPQ